MGISRKLLAAGLVLVCGAAVAQTSQRTPTTQIRGNNEINVTARDMTAVAIGEGNVAKNRIGVIQGNKTGNTKITVSASNVTTVAVGRNKKACTNIGGVVNDDCK